MLYETLGEYFSINSSGTLSILYRYCASLIYPIQKEFDSFETWRTKQKIIAMCKWQKGQLTNVLNYLYPSTVSPYIPFSDPVSGIYVTEVSTTYDYFSIAEAGKITESPAPDYTGYASMAKYGTSAYSPASDYTSFVTKVDNQFIYIGYVTFHVPSDVDQDELKETIDQINIGVNYNIVTI